VAKHFIKYRPTVFDQFPLDVIQYQIFPFLDYTSRIHLNLCLPNWDRVPTKMNKMSMLKHDQDTCIATIRQIFDEIDGLEAGEKKFKILTKLFKLNQLPRYFRLIQQNEGYRNMYILKIREVSEAAIDYRGQVELNTRLKFVSECKKLRNKIENSGPYGPTLILGNALPLNFT
jgi:hypothetical protein